MVSFRYCLPLVLIAAFVAGSARPRAAQPSPAAAGDEVTFRIIVVSSADEAERIVERRRRGEPFATLARMVSIDPTADAGGLIGPIARVALRPELRDALQGMGVGQLTRVIQVPTGFAVLEVEPTRVATETATAETASTKTAARAPASAALAAIGSVKYVFGVAGLGEAQASLREYPKPVDWELDPRTICRLRTESVTSMRTSLERAVAPGARDSLAPVRRMQAHYGLGQLYAYDARMDEAIAQFELARAIVAGDAAEHSEAAVLALQLEEALGIAYLHKAHVDNGVFHQPGERCLLSHTGLKALPKTDAAKQAIEHFGRYLAQKPDDLEVRWLLNVAYMAVGAYPAGVPVAQLIPPTALASTEDVGRFVDVAETSGLVSFASAGGLVIDDFDNDGRLDVVTSSFDSCAPMRFFHREADGGFVERSAEAGFGDQVGGLNVVSTDYDNDGCVDLLLLRGAWDVAQRKSLLRNDCRGRFTDVTVASGLARPATATQAAVWADIDNDGFLDLFIASEDSPAQLFLNKRDGTFTDIGRAAGIARTAFSKAVGAGDYDNDGWIDLYVSNLNGPSVLYRNNHDRTFADVTEAAGVPGSGKSFNAWFFDYDNDGWLDLFSTSYFTSVDETVRTWLSLPHRATTLKLYRNRGGRFEDVTAQVGLDKVYMPMGSNFGDIDNDGFLDIYLGTGNPSYASVVPSVLLRNRAGQSFADVTASSGTGELHKGHGVAFADLDNDGDEELVFEVGGATPGDAHALRLFENPGHGNDWISLKLEGVRSNRAALGARITVTVLDGGGRRRAVHRAVSTGGSFGASPLEQHIGLGRDVRSVDVEVWWPTSDTKQRFSGVAKNQWLTIRELAERYEVRPRPSLRLGARPGRARSNEQARAR